MVKKINQGDFYKNKRTEEVFFVIDKITSPFEIEYCIIDSSFAKEPMLIQEKIFLNSNLELIDVEEFNRVNVRYIEQLDLTLEEKAKFFAISAHNSVYQYYGNCLYSEHLCDTVDNVKEYAHLYPDINLELAICIMWCHDIIEDARVTYNDVLNVLGKEVADGAFALTNNTGKSRKERADPAYYAKILKEGITVQFCKICDRIANMKNGKKLKHKMFDGYKKELDGFQKQVDPANYFTELFTIIKNL